MQSFRGYLAEIGRRGGTKSRRKLTRKQARAMVQAREANRAKRARQESVDDTSPAARAVYDALMRQMTPAQKLKSVADLYLAVTGLSRTGVRLRHPHASEEEVEYRVVAIRLGDELAARVRERSRDTGR